MSSSAGRIVSTVFKRVVEMGRADDLCFERFTVVQRGLLKTALRRRVWMFARPRPHAHRHSRFRLRL